MQLARLVVLALLLALPAAAAEPGVPWRSGFENGMPADGWLDYLVNFETGGSCGWQLECGDVPFGTQGECVQKAWTTTSGVCRAYPVLHFQTPPDPFLVESWFYYDTLRFASSTGWTTIGGVSSGTDSWHPFAALSYALGGRSMEISGGAVNGVTAYDEAGRRIGGDSIAPLATGGWHSLKFYHRADRTLAIYLDDVLRFTGTMTGSRSTFGQRLHWQLYGEGISQALTYGDDYRICKTAVIDPTRDPAPACVDACGGDASGDLWVGPADEAAVTAWLGKQCSGVNHTPACHGADLNDDGWVDLSDMALVVGSWGRECGARAPSNLPPPDSSPPPPPADETPPAEEPPPPPADETPPAEEPPPPPADEPAVTAGAPLDFDGDGLSDILMRHRRTGETLLLAMEGSTVARVLALPELAAGETVVGNADYDGDGFADVLCSDADGNLSLLRIRDGAVASRVAVGGPLPAGFEVAGSGDFDGDGKVDLALRNRDQGTFEFWFLDGSNVLDVLQVDAVPGRSWRVAGTADYDADGVADVLWHKRRSGQLVLWQLVDGAVQETALPALPMRVALFDAGDLDGDGRSDLMARDANTRQWMTAPMRAGGVGELVALPQTTPGTQPRPVARGDFDGDGQADLVVKAWPSQQRSVYFMEGASVARIEPLPDVDAGWREAGVAD